MDNNKKPCIGPWGILLSCFLTAAQLHAQGSALTRIDPPSWFTGSGSDTLDLLLYGPKVKNTPLAVQGPGIRILQSDTAFSGAYRLLRLYVPQSFLGQFYLMAGSGKKQQRIPYRVAPPAPATGKLRPSDRMYLLMPDRFANGSPQNDQLPGMTELPERQKINGRHGGDLQGVAQHLGHIRDLGFNALWMTPFIENNQPRESYHGYACTDFYRVDPRFGDMATVKTLSDSCRKLGIAWVLDCVYNHTGDRHPFYRDRIRNSWFHLSDSFRRSNYRISALTDPYAAPSEQSVMREGWFDHHMPDLDQRDPVLARYLIQQTLWWVAQTGAGGVRIDTYPYSDQAFLLQLLERLKKAFPEVFVFGETWEHIPTAQAAWTYNRMSDTQCIALDGVTDFQLAFALHRGLREPFGWNTGISNIYYTLAGDGLYRHPENLVTFVDNHDLDRAAALYKNDLPTLRIVYGLLYSQRGIPCVFYGSELGMDGAGPHGVIREDFPGGWPGDSLNLFNEANLSTAQLDMHRWLRALAGIRAAHPQHFSEGRRMQYIPQDSTYAYFIRYNDTVLGFFVNTGTATRQLPATRFSDWPLDWNSAEPLLPGTTRPAEGLLRLPPGSFGALRFRSPVIERSQRSGEQSK